MGTLSKKGEGRSSPSPNVKDEKDNKVGQLKDANEELDTTNIKVPAFPGTEKRVTLRAKQKTEFGHNEGDEFSVAEPNVEKILKTGKYEKVN